MASRYRKRCRGSLTATYSIPPFSLAHMQGWFAGFLERPVPAKMKTLIKCKTLGALLLLQLVEFISTQYSNAWTLGVPVTGLRGNPLVSNQIIKETPGLDTAPHTSTSQSHGSDCKNMHAHAIANHKEKRLRSLVVILQLKVMSQSSYRSYHWTTHFVSRKEPSSICPVHRKLLREHGGQQL